MPLVPPTSLGGGLTTLFDSTLGADTASIDSGAGGFSTGLTLLWILTLLRTDEATVTSTALITLNGDAGANYDRIPVTGTASAASSAPAVAQNNMLMACSGNNAQAGAAGMSALQILGYGQTTFHKTAIGTQAELDSVAANSQVQAIGFRWRNTAAVTRVTVNVGGGTVFRAGSRLTILGI